MYRVPGSYVAAVLLLLLLVARADSQPPAPAAVPQTSEKSDSGHSPDIAKAAQEIISKAIERYRSLETYRDQFSITNTIENQDEDGDEWSQETAQEGTFVYSRPNRFALRNDEVTVVSDGANLWTCVQRLGQYTQVDAPKNMDLAAALEQSPFTSGLVHPAAIVLASEETDLFKLVPSIKKIDRAVAEELRGRNGHRIHGRIQLSNMPFTDESPFSVWIDAETHMVHEIRLDFTDGYKNMMEEAQVGLEEDEGLLPPSVKRAVLVLSFNSIVLDGDVDNDQFAFTPDDTMKKVTDFVFNHFGDTAQLELIGKPAPDISGPDMDDHPLSLAALKGKVVLLDFWATWCSPCVQALPHIQDLAERFKNKPVVVLGVNRDYEGMEKQVRKLLDKKKITFRQYVDSEGTVAEAYHVTGIPCTVLIDTSGVIQDIETGFGLGGEEHLADKIEKLLKGEQIFDPDDIEARISNFKSLREGYDDTGSNGESVVTSAALTEYLPTRLVSSASIAAQGNGWQARKLDINGDGRLELVVPDWQGGLNIFNADGSGHRLLRLSDSGYRRSLSDYEFLRDSGGPYWLVSFTKQLGFGVNQSASVGLYSEQGERKWLFEPELPAKVNSSMKVAGGDLTGDGNIEIVVAMNTYKLRPQGSNSWYHENQQGYLLVFDLDGNRLCQRKTGGQIDYVAVMPASEPGAQTMIFLSCSGKIQKLHYDPSADTPPADGTPSTNGLPASD